MLTSYWEAVQKRVPQLLLLSAGAALVAYVVVRSLGPTYQVHFSYLVSLSEREEAADFRFDGYYALSATDLFSVTLAQWLTTPEAVVAAFREGNVPLADRDSRQLAGVVTAERASAQLVTVTVSHRTQQQAEALAFGLQEVMRRNIEQYHEQGTPALRFKVVATEPWVGVSSLSVPVIVSAVFVFVLLVSTNLVVLRESIRQM